MSDTETDDGTEMPSTTDYEKGEKEPLNHGAKVRAKVKRGTGTRDQDVLVIEGRGENHIEACAEFEASLQVAEQNDWADRLRSLRAEDETDG